MCSQRYYTEDLLIENIYEPYPLRNRPPLSVTHPELSLEWLYKKNCGYGPEDFSYGSNVKVWWQCDKKKSHKWQAQICNRTAELASGCPFCVEESYGFDLTQYPEALQFFDWRKNKGIEPSKIPVGDGIYWRCDEAKDHQWFGKFNENVLDAFCPFCRGRKASKDYNLSHFKDIAAQWDTKKNGSVRPKDIAPGSKIKYWFKCLEGPDHEFFTSPYARAIEGHGCKFCSEVAFCKSRSLAVLNPQFARQWHKTKNGDLKPTQVTQWSKVNVWWACPKGPDHEWETRLADRVRRDKACPFCTNRRLSVTNSLAALYPDVAKEFDLKKNAPYTPETVIAFCSKIQYWWRCKNNHEWQRFAYLRTRRGSDCPECPKQKEVANSLAELNPTKAALWHPSKNGNLSPSQVTCGSKKYVWWKCNKGPDHEWQLWIRQTVKQTYECPFCEGLRLSVTNSLAALYPELAKEWITKKNDRKASDLLPGSNYKAWWRCHSCRHEWQRECYLRAYRQSACPSCRIPSSTAKTLKGLN